MADKDLLAHKLETVLQEVSHIKHALLGDASDESKPGMVVRLDRVEQKIRNRDKVLWLFTGAVVSLTVNRILAGW